MTYKLVADSSANLIEMPDVDFTSVPMKISTAIGEYVDEAGVKLVEMIDYLYTTKDKSTTSCPAVGDWMKAFGEAAEIYVFTISSNLSGSYNSAMIAMQDYLDEHVNAKVHIFDTKATGPNLEMGLEKVKELKNKGLSFEEVCEAVENYLANTEIYFVLASVRNLANNGRVPRVVASITDMLGIRMVGKGTDGRIEVVGKAKGDRKSFKLAFEKMLENGFKGGNVKIAHCMNEEGAAYITSLIKEKFPSCNITSRATTALCSYYAEKGGLILGYEKG